LAKLPHRKHRPSGGITNFATGVFMSEDNTQAVVDETKGAAQPAPAETSARTDDDLDTLLNEFDAAKPAATSTAQPEPRVEAAPDKVANDTVLKEAEFIRSERFKRDIGETVKEVRGDLPADLYDDQLVQAWIDSRAMSDPRLGRAWAERYENPQAFARVKTALGKEFAKKYGRFPDKQATEDRDAVTAAVRGASTRAPEGKAPDYARMTPAEFQAEKDRLLGR
jgi:hypothetical protein